MPTVMVRETASAPQPTGEHRRTRRIVAVAAVDGPGGAARERARRFDSDRYAERMEAPLAT